MEMLERVAPRERCARSRLPSPNRTTAGKGLVIHRDQFGAILRCSERRRDDHCDDLSAMRASSVAIGKCGGMNGGEPSLFSSVMSAGCRVPTE